MGHIEMTITLNGKTYRPARDSDGNRVVIVETGPRTSRLADPEIAAKVMRGFLLVPLSLGSR
jgi:hypothetical protein